MADPRSQFRSAYTGHCKNANPPANHFAGVLLLGNSRRGRLADIQRKRQQILFYTTLSLPEGNTLSSKQICHFKQVFFKYTSHTQLICKHCTALWTRYKLINSFGPMLHMGHLLGKLVIVLRITNMLVTWGNAGHIEPENKSKISKTPQAKVIFRGTENSNNSPN